MLGLNFILGLIFFTHYLTLPGMALGFFNLGPRTHMSGQIGVSSILGGSQNLGDTPLRSSFCCCYEKE